MSKSQHTLKLNDELQFLITCCKTTLTENDITIIQTYLHTKNVDQNALIALANQHGILPLVYKTIKKLQPKNSSIQHSTSNIQHFLSELKPHYMTIVQKNMLMSAELIRIMKLLEENGIEALAFKGPVLSQTAYGDVTLRQYVDLDVLVSENDAYKAGKIMYENGHNPILPLSLLSNKTCLHAAKDFSLVSKSGVHTELHWRLFEKKYNISLLSCASEQKCQTVSINRNTVQTLQNELLLVYLCLHGAKHTFERIEWICDIDRLIRISKIDWDAAISFTEQSHSNRAFYLGLSLAKELMHTPLSKKLEKQLYTREIKELKNLVLQYINRTHKEKSDFAQNKDTFLFQSKLFDKKSNMVQFYLSTFFHISTNDCQIFRLPTQLTFLYIILRPLRLLWSYSMRIIQAR